MSPGVMDIVTELIADVPPIGSQLEFVLPYLVISTMRVVCSQVTAIET